MTREAMNSDLIERLLERGGDTSLRNPDGPAAVMEIERLRGINAALMGDDETAPRYTTKRLKQEIARAVEGKDSEIERLRAKLAEAEKVIAPFSDMAKHHAADAPEWRDHHAVHAMVLIGHLRAAAEWMEKGDE